MNFRSKWIRILVVAAAVLPACTKFPEGGRMGNAKRLFTNDTRTCYSVRRFIVDGVDSTNLLISSGDNTKLQEAFCVTESSHTEYYSVWNSPWLTCARAEEKITFYAKDTRGYMTLYDSTRCRNFICPEKDVFTWEIRRCKGGELWLNDASSSKVYRLEMKKWQ